MNFNRIHSLRQPFILLLICAAALAATSWAGTPCDNVTGLLYCQTFDHTGNAYASQYDSQTYGNMATTWDDFRVNGSGLEQYSVDNIHWVGSSITTRSMETLPAGPSAFTRALVVTPVISSTPTTTQEMITKPISAAMVAFRLIATTGTRLLAGCCPKTLPIGFL